MERFLSKEMGSRVIATEENNQDTRIVEKVRLERVGVEDLGLKKAKAGGSEFDEGEVGDGEVL